MLTRFFYTLRDAGIPVSVTEYLTLLEALEARVAEYSVDEFYHLARCALVKDEKHFDRYDRAFAQHFKGIEQAFAGLDADIPAEWLRLAMQRVLTDEERRRSSRSARAEGSPRGRQQVDRHGRHLTVRSRRLQPGRHPDRRCRRQPQCGQGLGETRVPQSR
jgi:uncharacterized protein with von Willebrand factor type A (vWA) domain